jgi:hypothetical protein
MERSDRRRNSRTGKTATRDRRMVEVSKTANRDHRAKETRRETADSSSGNGTLRRRTGSAETAPEETGGRNESSLRWHEMKHEPQTFDLQEKLRKKA